MRFPDDIMEEGGNLAGRIEAILFVAGEAVRVEDLSKALDVPIREVEDALIQLRDEYDFNQRGFSLKRYGHQVQLATRALYSQDVVRLLLSFSSAWNFSRILSFSFTAARKSNVSR